MTRYLALKNDFDSAAYFANSALSIWSTFKLNGFNSQINQISAFLGKKSDADKGLNIADSLVKKGRFENYAHAFKLYNNVNSNFPNFADKRLNQLANLINICLAKKDTGCLGV